MTTPTGGKEFYGSLHKIHANKKLKKRYPRLDKQWYGD